MFLASWPGVLNGNPFLDILADSLESHGARFISVDSPSEGIPPEAEALLVQWPDKIFWRRRRGWTPYLAALSELNALWRWRRSGKKLIWIVHNDVPHDLAPAERRLWFYFSRALSHLANGYMTLSPATQSVVLRGHPGLSAKPAGSFRHPAYRAVTRTPAQALARRQHLGVPQDAYVIGALGRIGGYKGLPELIDAFRAIRDSNLRLLICGRPRNAAAREEVKAAVGDDTRVLLRFDLLSDEDFALTTAACDVMVAPYRHYLHSGTLVYLACAERRSLTPMTPFADDLAKCVGPGWMTLYEGCLNPEVLHYFIASKPPQARPVLTALDPSLAAKDILEFIRSL
jgi:glycosyltransferase involved in cell wall biosynthesis